MSSETILHSAQFNPKVKQYWLVLWLLVTTVTLFGIVFIPVIAIVVWLVSGRMLAAMSATLSEKKLFVKRGILVRTEKTIPLDKITDVGLTQGPLMRLFGIHQLSFETAGQSGTGALVSLIGVVDAQQFREAILAQKERLAEHQQTQSESMSQPSDQALLARLVEVVERIDTRLKHLEQRSD